jgi:hypothetical protein
MLKAMGLALAALLVAVGGAAATTTGPRPLDTPLDAERGLLVDATGKLQANDEAGALPLLKAAVAAPTFADLGDDQRYAALVMYGGALFATEDYTGALTQLRTASGFSEADGMVWSLRFLAAQAARNQTDALLSLTAIAQRWPASLSRISDQNVDGLALYTRTDRPLADARIALLEALDRAGWTPKNVDMNVDGLWMDLTLAFLDRGQVDKAGAAARKVVDPQSIADMRVDLRFDPVTSADLAWFDVRRAADRRQHFLQATSKASPDSLAGINATARLLLGQDRPREAVALLEGAIKRARAADATPFTDKDQLNVTYDALSMALFLLGQGDESIAAMKAGAQLQEHGQTNVSQKLDLGARYVELGRPDDALAAVSDVGPDDVSNFGRTVLESVHAMAYVAKNDGPRMAAAVTYLKAHADDSPVNLVDVLVVVGDQDGAAEETIKLLADPLNRREILSLMQDAIVPDTTPDFSKAFRRKITALRERPDVKAAVERVGRIESWPLIDTQI